MDNSPTGITRTRWAAFVGYAGAHLRVRRLHGPATGYTCDRCGRAPAKHWALVHGSPRQLVDQVRGHPYSPDPADYRPLCVPCHKRADLAELAHRITEWLW